MNQTELVTSIGNTLTKIDTALMGDDLLDQPNKWQQLYALRKHLDDEQRLLVKADIDSDDLKFQALSGTIAVATKQLNQKINDMTKVDSIIDIVSQIAANVDSVLQLF